MPSVQDMDVAVPSFRVEVDGTALAPELALRVAAVTVDERIDLPTMFAIQLGPPQERDEQFAWIDAQQFSIGGTVKIGLGYNDTVETLCEGEITGLEPAFTRSALPTLTVRGYDPSHRLNRQRKTRTFLQQKDSDIASRIAQEAGLTLQASDSQVTHDYVLQVGQTDLEFLRARARSVGFELVIEGKTLHFRPVNNAQGEILTLSLDDDLLEFYPRLSTLRQFSELEVRGWDPKAKQEIVGLARSGDEVARMGGRDGGAAVIEGAFGASAALVADFPVRTQAEADRLALGRFNSMALQLIGGEGLARGNARIRAGNVIKLESLGQRFSGNYYVTAAAHRYSVRHAFHTHFTTRRNAS